MFACFRVRVFACCREKLLADEHGIARASCLQLRRVKAGKGKKSVAVPQSFHGDPAPTRPPNGGLQSLQHQLVLARCAHVAVDALIPLRSTVSRQASRGMPPGESFVRSFGRFFCLATPVLLLAAATQPEIHQSPPEAPRSLFKKGKTPEGVRIRPGNSINPIMYPYVSSRIHRDPCV